MMPPTLPSVGPYARGPVAVQTGSEAAAFDARAIRELGVPQPVLMESAGRAAAAVVQRIYPRGPVLGVVGGGNNGGDALVALRTLAAWGRETRAVLVSNRPTDAPLLHGWPVPVEVEEDGDGRPSGLERALERCAVVMDGVLGTGIRGAPRSRQAAAIRKINASGRSVVALDVPSGIDAEAGAVPGEAVRADATIAFGAPKLGALLPPARALVGRHIVVEIGFPPLRREDASAELVVPEWARARFPRRESDTHKNAVGRLLVLAGAPGMAGAALLTARAAWRCGVGLVRVATPPGNREVVQAALPEAIWVDATDGAALEEAVAASDSLVAGPGLGRDAWAADALRTVLAAKPDGPTLLDADALNLAAAGAVSLAGDADGVRPLLLTPHPGEMARLLADPDPDRDPDPGGPARATGPAARVRAAAHRFGCTVLLKGAPSLVASPTGPLLVDTQGSSDLASAGMGDTLSGACGAFLAQGLAPADAAATGLYVCGRAARLADLGVALTPSDLLVRIPEALRERASAPDSLGLPFVVLDAEAAR